MMSAATAPTARADAFSDIISSVEDEFTAGQAEFASASADFGSGDPSDGLSLFFSGLDDDVVGPGDSVYLQTVLVLLNEPDSSGPFFFDIGPAADFTSGLADPQSSFSTGEDLFAQAATDLSSGDYFDPQISRYSGQHNPSFSLRSFCSRVWRLRSDRVT